MPNQELNSLQDYERFVSTTIKPWSREKRTALAAAMAERWLPVYQAFSEKYDWGNPAPFQDAVQAVWNSLLGHKLTREELESHHKLTKKNTPHMDDFDCEDALATCAMVWWALNSCAGAYNTDSVVMSMVGAFEGIAPGIYEYPEKLPPNVWQKPKVQKELEKQLKLLQVIGDMTEIGEPQIKALHQKLTSADLRGPRAPRAKRKRGLTNEEIFERYRRRIQSELINAWPYNMLGFGDISDSIILHFTKWAHRYLVRQHEIEKMKDVVAHDALLARNSAHDAAVQGDHGWDQHARVWVNMNYAHPDTEYDVASSEEPHHYGPSFRRLCVLATESDKQVWKSPMDWASHEPPAWEEENRRKMKGLAYAAPDLGKRLDQKVSWRTTGDVDHPWVAEVAGKTWRVRLNDFPDDLMYTLLINDAVVGKFHDWPASWQR